MRAAVAEWNRYRIVACLVTSSSPVPLKTRRVGQRCTLNQSRAETSSSCSPTGFATAYQLLHRFSKRQVANSIVKNDVNLALSPIFRYVSIESSL
ncbi:hypothetical protein TNCV_2205621 [Trichonephila clavipes]|nr:hypothetical protein TNCV_2205621 [Trichonephila clavipes]